MQQKHLKQDTVDPKVDSIHLDDDKILTQKIALDELLGLDPLEEAMHFHEQNPKHRGAVR